MDTEKLTALIQQRQAISAIEFYAGNTKNANGIRPDSNKPETVNIRLPSFGNLPEGAAKEICEKLNDTLRPVLAEAILLIDEDIRSEVAKQVES